MVICIELIHNTETEAPKLYFYNSAEKLPLPKKPQCPKNVILYFDCE